MYESHWQLDERPFENVAADRFYFPCESHQGALLKLRYAVENRRGGALLIGEPGLGKTLLVRALANQLPDDVAPRVRLLFPQLPPDQILGFLAGELGAAAADTQSMQQSLRYISAILAENTRQGRHALLVIDEAHLLSETGALDTVRLLLNLETNGKLDLTLLLIGQTTLLPIINRHPQLEERLGVKALLRPLTHEETASYLQHRLAVAGAAHGIFDAEAVDSIYRLSLGIPRRINRLADLALLIGYAEEHSELSAAHIEAVADELIAVAP